MLNEENYSPAYIILPSKSLLFWKIDLNKIPSDDNLINRGCNMVSWYDLCHSNNETSSHLFLFCRFARDVSNWCSSLLNFQLTPISIIQMLNVCDRGWTRQCKEVLFFNIFQIKQCEI